MKRLFKVLVILSIVILFISCGRKVTSEEVEEKIAQHMYERYGEEFEVGYAMIDGYTKGDRDVTWYEARVTPIRYIGTPKYTDSYYRAVGTVMVKKKMFREEFGITRDTYSNVMLKESANEFYGKKLKELFGENYLSVLEVTGSYSDKSKNFEGSVKLTKEKGDRLYISGGIYIFGRVENDEDREWYRKQIYEFIQFMKETGTFEYVDLDIIIVDERALISNPQKLLENFPKNLSESDQRKKKREMIKAGDKEFASMTQKEILNKINSINKAEYRDRFFGGLLYVKAYSPKYIKAQKLDNREEKEYDTINSIKFDWETW
ncbi:hypothetical protein [Fusobacterium varium]|uniref:hypothetical protein n=1 Tax=Fusobacterium varium TaxID=856 RepID=UPI000E4138EB|nr:hypothetical protein [Fusobacterium varium]RGJ31566.1 hypothetical protein DXD66_01610 [Fusobacterium varium]